MAGVKRNKCDRAELRKRVILEASRAFAKSGIKNVHMDSLACALSISKRTLYELFEDKETLLTECINLSYTKMKLSMKQLESEPITALEIALLFYEELMSDLAGLTGSSMMI